MKIPLIFLLVLVAGASSAGGAPMPLPWANDNGAIKKNFDNILTWSVVEKSEVYETAHEKRVSPPFKRYSMCARTVIEAESPTSSNAIVNDDVIDEQIQMYRIYALPSEAGCRKESIESYFHVTLNNIDEPMGLALARDFSAKRWTKALGLDKPPQFQFDQAISSSRRDCLLNERIPFEILSFKALKAEKGLEGTIILGSCDSADSRILLQFKGGPASSIDFKNIPKQMLE